MTKTITFYRTTSPYSFQDSVSTIKIAESALNKGHKVNVVAFEKLVGCFNSCGINEGKNAVSNFAN